MTDHCSPDCPWTGETPDDETETAPVTGAECATMGARKTAPAGAQTPVAPGPRHESLGGLVTDQNSTPTSLYRYYDGRGVLLYVGITGRGATRNHEHNMSKAWWPFVLHQDVTHYQTRGEALDAERAAIRRFRPPFNTQHNPGHELTRAAYMAMREVGVSPPAMVQHAIPGAKKRLPLNIRRAKDMLLLTTSDRIVQLVDVRDLSVVNMGNAKLIELDVHQGILTARVRVRKSLPVQSADLMLRHEPHGRLSVKRIDVHLTPAAGA